LRSVVDPCVRSYLVTRRLHISSSANDRVKRLRRLVRSARREDVFVVHGHRAIRRALDSGIRIRELYTSPELHLGAAHAAIAADAAGAGADVVWLSRESFLSLGGLPRPDGLVAVAERCPLELDDLPAQGLALVAERIERPGNLGTIVRTACAAGAAALVAADPRTDLFYPEVVHASVGTIFELPVAAAPTRRCSPGGPVASSSRHQTARGRTGRSTTPALLRSSSATNASA
jgi:RNA methyltransferase, TrmH family